MLLRLLIRAVVVAVLAGAGLLAWAVFGPSPPAPALPPSPAPPVRPRSPALAVDCTRPAALLPAALADAASLTAAAWAPSGPPEAGWAVYAPLAAHEVGGGCPAGTPGFSAALGRWRAAHALPGGEGAMDEATLRAMALGWLLRRPFVQATRRGECPPAPDAARLAGALPGETYGGKPVQGLPAALDAWRRMRDAARAEVPALAADPGLLALASGFRGPEEEAARCADGGCDALRRARCSAHRTGAAFDLTLAPGMSFSTDDANRTALARTPAYAWLAANADRFGFAPYAFEPWHWEWTGDHLTPAPP